jgi:hypothetical protein
VYICRPTSVITVVGIIVFDVSECHIPTEDGLVEI